VVLDHEGERLGGAVGRDRELDAVAVRGLVPFAARAGLAERRDRQHLQRSRRAVADPPAAGAAGGTDRDLDPVPGHRERVVDVGPAPRAVAHLDQEVQVARVLADPQREEGAGAPHRLDRGRPVGRRAVEHRRDRKRRGIDAGAGARQRHPRRGDPPGDRRRRRDLGPFLALAQQPLDLAHELPAAERQRQRGGQDQEQRATQAKHRWATLEGPAS
jgi:hypothetical protein